MKAPLASRTFSRRGVCFFVCFLLPFISLPDVGLAENFEAAQDPNFVIVNWQVQDGLPSARIHEVIQTRDGYIWLATPEGLAKFDGLRFERFYDPETPQIANAMVRCLLEDHQGRVWYGTQSGEVGWEDPAGFHKLDLRQSGSLDSVERIVETSDGMVWVASRHALLPIADCIPGKAMIRPENHDVWDICAVEGGGLWVLVDGGNVYHLDTKMRKMFLTIPGQSGQWRNIAPARSGGLWVRDGECIRRWQHDEWVEDRGVIDLEVTENVVMQESPSGVLMIGTYGQGLWLLGSDRSQYRLDQSSGLSQDQVLSLYEDREKDIWVGTVHGLNRLSRRVVKMIAPADNWQNRAVSTIAPAQAGGFWVGTEGAGLYRINTDGQMLFHQAEDVWHQDYVRCVLEDAKKQIWTGIYNRGLRLRDKDHPLGQYLPGPTTGFPNALFQDSQKAVWVGTTMGAACYDAGSRIPTQILLTNSDVRCFAEAGDGSIWIGLQGGRLFRYNRISKQVEQVYSETLRSSIHALYCSTDRTVWVGTWRNGLAYLKDGRWGTLTHEQGLADDSISDIQPDIDGNLWIGSASGIFRINRTQLDKFTEGQIKSVNCLQLGSGDGLGTWEIMGGYQPIACRSADGRLWYVTSAGLAVADPQAIRQNNLPPSIVIKSLLVDGKPISNAILRLGLSSGNTFAPCPAGTSQLEVRYTGISLPSPKQVRFRYRLKGFEASWIDAEDQRVAYFSHLPPGKYVFEVIACNNHGVWSQEGARLAFQVLPLFWQTLWFKLLVWLAVVVVIVLVYKIRMARLRAIERLRQQIARDLHDEVGANLGSISLLAEVMEQAPQPGDLAQVRLTADQTVDTLRDLVWIINPSQEHLGDLVARLKQIAARMLANVSYEFEENDLPANLKLSLELRRNVPPLFKEVLNNIRKHSRAVHVAIKLCYIESCLVLEVKDDGVGFDVSKKGFGDGLNNFQNRASEMHAKLTITSQPEKGTTICLAVPITKTRGWRMFVRK